MELALTTNACRVKTTQFRVDVDLRVLGRERVDRLLRIRVRLAGVEDQFAREFLMARSRTLSIHAASIGLVRGPDLANGPDLLGLGRTRRWQG